ncbi:MAG: hypothetical protein KGZ74_09460 [Chitinophagaceae bacterium]|nr:hypothetical protein [Chitinophagaceae bacterium]
MKQTLVLLSVVFVLASCNNNTATSSEPAATTTAPAADVPLPFALAEPYKNWAIGSNENVAVAMKGLKAFIDNDFTALASIIGDSISLDFDQYQAKLSRDSAIKFFTGIRPTFNDITITMYDYVSVVSADKKSEWVTMWYKQNWKDSKGVADSMNYVNDIRLENGKMVELNEKGSRFMKK